MSPGRIQAAPSFAGQGFWEAEFNLSNRRDDASYYEISVIDNEMNEIPFATNRKVMFLEYEQFEQVTIFIRREDINKTHAVCTRSVWPVGTTDRPMIASKICSRIITDR